MNQRMIFGLGSGRSGTMSLANLLNRMPEVVCFHESNPSGMAWSGSERTVQSILNDFELILSGGSRGICLDLTLSRRAERDEALRKLDTLTRIEAVCDVASYYLPYVEFILSRQPKAVFPCLKRNREDTINSFIKKVALPPQRPSKSDSIKAALGMPPKPRPISRNHWLDHDGSEWSIDRKWDKCFPKYEAELSLREAVSRYYDDYYNAARKLEKRHPAAVKIFDLEALNDPVGQSEILDFCRVSQRNPFEPSHINKGQKQTS
ncbi:hypothetical protein [Roseovarius aestuariivivens]|uniref:hypothetical protein n=1 Tax=Roseovarius aestuariivivens TaxID=1888910 RepID=UPI00108025EF|nr:hypothetical protein [Roseovarius aestuariivivens]